MTDQKLLGNRIRLARKEHGMSQSELADLVQISTSHMSDIENGKTTIGIDIFMRITECLQVSADWLLQTNIPSVSNIQSREFNEILSGCSSAEKQAILEVASKMKKAFHDSNK